MPRVGRKAAGGVIYHVLNRANARARLFAKPADYDAFVRALADTKAAVPGVRVLAYCLMPNHWHLVLWPRRDGELSRFMLRLCTTHVRRRHAHRAAAGAGGAGGHLYQGRFKSFPVEDDQRYLLTLLRYVESNPLRARPPLARRPGGWRWTSFAARAAARAVAPGDARAEGSKAKSGQKPRTKRGTGPREELLLDEWPVQMPRNWEALLAEALDDDRLAAVRTSVTRGRPYGREQWVRRTAERLGLEFTLRPRGRPRKDPAASAASSRPAGRGRRKGTRIDSKRPGKGP